MKGRQATIAGVLIVVALGFVVFRGLGNATMFFRTASEAVSQMDKLGERRFRIQGVVLDDPQPTPTTDGSSFVIQDDGVDVMVRHQGDPPELFQPNVPVVLEGHFAATSTKSRPVYESDRILVKHSSTYTAKNPDRVKDY